MNPRTDGRTGSSQAGVAALLAFVAMLAPVPVAADWLVTKDGARIETKGAWRVDGRRVIFDLPNGTLSTIRVDEVDLDRSAVATAEARAAAENPNPVVAPKKEPVLRLTEKDIPPAGEAPAEGEEAGEGKATGTSAAAELEVISWEKIEGAGGDSVEVFGTIRNNGANMILSPTLLVAIYDADGGLLATNSGVVNSPQIAAGKTANFRVSFGGLTDFAAVKFDAQGRGYKQRAENAGATDEENADVEELEAAPVETEIEPPSGES